MNKIQQLIGKRVLFVDLETTGFPKNKGSTDYTNNKNYDSSRIVQVGWYYSDSFSEDSIDQNSIKSLIRKPEDFFSIPRYAVDVHKISYAKALKEGTDIKHILDNDFGKAILACDCIVSYNIKFDFGILANEVFRSGKVVMYEKMLALEQGNAVCVMKATTEYLDSVHSQSNAYLKMYGKAPENQHDARGDVVAMMMIIKHMIKNKKLNPDTDSTTGIIPKFTVTQSQVLEHSDNPSLSQTLELSVKRIEKRRQDHNQEQDFSSKPFETKSLQIQERMLRQKSSI